ncbi:glutamine amidotransferase [Amnibacterium sp. CER49]|uniref:type 1 glutamine amidotransferase n=1 Tax=Amnibacterium sp. CER49 TaxID=3039161 RepID=UPI0024472767|nr:glutamine amidotransferase [Amnibacterium sp. CER49]MDH2443569.1 glutamine amidotransferase [Amnibacterium sp. CER49]
MTGEPLTIAHLYPHQMNIYGDHGNVLALQRRAQWHGYEPEVLEVHPGDPFPARADVIVGGGGQDSGQSKVTGDLGRHADEYRDAVEDGTPVLLVCGMYQLFGRAFVTSEGERLPGIGVLDLETTGSSKRIIGNVAVESDEFGTVIGFENHSGRTVLGSGGRPLGHVAKGRGNNGTDGTEGVRYRNVIGTYLHGSVLPKNPRVADFLLETAAVRRHGSFHRGTPDDARADAARRVAASRPR